MNDQQRAAMQMALDALGDWKAWDDAVNQYPVWADKDKVAITALREALENNELSDVTLINEGDMAQLQVAPDGRVAKTVFTFEDMQKAAEMGYESGKAEAEALAHPQGKECKYNSGICNRRGCRGICQATELGKKYRELEAQPQDHSEQHLNMVQGEPFGYLRQTDSATNPPHGWAFHFNSGDVPIYTTPPVVLQVVTEGNASEVRSTDTGEPVACKHCKGTGLINNGECIFDCHYCNGVGK